MPPSPVPVWQPGVFGASPGVQRHYQLCRRLRWGRQLPDEMCRRRQRLLSGLLQHATGNGEEHACVCMCALEVKKLSVSCKSVKNKVQHNVKCHLNVAAPPSLVSLCVALSLHGRVQAHGGRAHLCWHWWVWDLRCVQSGVHQHARLIPVWLSARLHKGGRWTSL